MHMAAYDPLSQGDADQPVGTQDSQARSPARSRHVAGVRLLAGGHANRPLSATLVQTGTPARYYSQLNPAHYNDTFEARADPLQPSGALHHGVRLLKAKPAVASALGQLDNRSRRDPATRPLVSSSSPLEPRLLKLPVQEQPHLHAGSGMTNAGDRRSHSEAHAGSVITMSLRTGANAAAQVFEHLINDTDACSAHCHASFLGVNNATSNEALHLQPAQAQPAQAQPAQAQHVGGQVVVGSQCASRMLRPSMANRLVELTTMQESLAAINSHTASVRTAANKQQSRATTLEHPAADEAREAHLPIDTLMQVRIRRGKSGGQTASQVISVGTSRAAAAEREPNVSAAATRSTSTCNIVACNAQPSINNALQYCDGTAVGATHNNKFTDPLKTASAPSALQGMPDASNTDSAGMPREGMQADTQAGAAELQAASAASINNSSALQPVYTCPLREETCEVASRPRSSNNGLTTDINSNARLLRGVGGYDDAANRSHFLSSGGAVELTEICVRGKPGCVTCPDDSDGVISEAASWKGCAGAAEAGAGAICFIGGEVRSSSQEGPTQAETKDQGHPLSAAAYAQTFTLQGTSEKHPGRGDWQADRTKLTEAADAADPVRPRGDEHCTEVDGEVGKSSRGHTKAEHTGHDVSCNGSPTCTEIAQPQDTALAGLAPSQQQCADGDSSVHPASMPPITSEIAQNDKEAPAIHAEMHATDVITETLTCEAGSEHPPSSPRDTTGNVPDQQADGPQPEQQACLMDVRKMSVTATELSVSDSVNSSPRILSVAQTGLRSASQSPAQRSSALRSPMSPTGPLELQDQIGRRAQKILNNTCPEAPERVARETDDVEQVTPAIFELIHSWLLEPGNADTLFGHAETIGAGILAKKLYEAGVGGRGTELEHGYLTASLTAGSIMVHGIPTLFGDADDVAMSLPDLKAAVDDCARAGKSSPILFKETQLTVHASAWEHNQLEPIVAFNAIDWEGTGDITMMQLCHLLVTWHSFGSIKNVRKSGLALRRMLAAAFQQAYIRDTDTDAFTWKQICRLLGVKEASHAANDLIAEAKQAGRKWAEGTASSALDNLRCAQGGITESSIKA